MPDIFVSKPELKPKPKSLRKPRLSRHLLTALAFKPKQISFETQREKETIILLMRRHWVTNLGWILLTITLVLLPLFSPFFPIFQVLPSRFQLITILVWYLLNFAFFLENFLSWYFNVYIVTDERIVDIDFFSLIYKEISDARIENIQDVTYSMGGLFRALFNYGNILIQTAAEHPVFEFDAIPKPAWVVQKINEVIEKKQK